MDRQYYIALAKQGIRMPIGADLILKAHKDHEARVLDGKLLGEVIVETARVFKTPLAFPLMDLTLEKEWILTIMGVPKEEREGFHFSSCPSEEEVGKAMSAVKNTQSPPTPRMKATCGAISHAAACPGLVPCRHGDRPVFADD